MAERTDLRATFDDHLNESDSVLWSIERDPGLRTTIVAVALLDPAPDWARLRATMADLTAEIPRLRQKVVEPPMRMSTPRWVDDPSFDLDYHLRRVRVPAPADVRAVLDLAGRAAMDAFDKDRPLWEFTLVEGLEDGRAAFVQKVHHSMTDGVGGMEMARRFLDRTPDGTDRPAPTSAPPARTAQGRNGQGHEGTVAGLTTALRSNARTLASVTRRTVTKLPRAAVSTMLDPVGAARTTTRTIESAGKLLRPVRAPLSPLLTGRGMSRHFDVIDVGLDEMMAAAHAVDGSLNDAFLAAISGGMRRYHDHHGVPAQVLRVTMPINLRRAGDGLGSNKFTPVRFALSVTTLDAAERMRELGAVTRRWRREPALPLSEVIAGGLNRLPVEMTTSLFGAMLKAVDFVATNIPGIAERSYLAGAEVVREYAFAPPSGAAFSVALLSHGDQCCIGVNLDTSAVPDPDVFVACLRDGFDEVIAVGSGR